MPCGPGEGAGVHSIVGCQYAGACLHVRYRALQAQILAETFCQISRSASPAKGLIILMRLVDLSPHQTGLAAITAVTGKALCTMDGHLWQCRRRSSELKLCHLERSVQLHPSRWPPGPKEGDQSSWTHLQPDACHA